MSAAVEVRGLSFAYAGSDDAVLRDVDLTVEEGAFALICGPTGSGKTTLLRLLKPEIAPAGTRAGTRTVHGVPVEQLGLRESAQGIAYVFQNPENQIVCDTVWHELAFGLENIGMPVDEMRLRVAETCTWLGIGAWFRSRCDELSGGQQQVLALAGALALHPRLLLLDEPTSMLDPVAEKSFMALLYRANRELGTTVIVATHRPWAYRAYASCAFVLEDGRAVPCGLGSLAAPSIEGLPPAELGGEGAVQLDDVWFRYQRDGAWVLRGLDLSLAQGELRALMGGNGSGKSTVLALVAGTLKPQRGRRANRLAASQAYLPQNPKALLARETVREELDEWAPTAGYGQDAIDEALERSGLAGMGERHPYDLSGGQQQLLALEKLLLTNPKLLLLDEPSKGLDPRAARLVAARVCDARDRGAAILMATHDTSFARATATSATLLFDGQAAATLPRDEFFSRSWLLGN